MKKQLIAFLLAFITTYTHAGNWHYVQNGLSKHFGTVEVQTGERVEKRDFYVHQRKITEIRRFPIYEEFQFNEQNVGAGLEYSQIDNGRVKNYYGGYYLDSERNDAFYFGTGLAWRFKPTKYTNLDVGGLGIMLSRKHINEGMPFPAVLPYISVGTNKVAVNTTFIPAVKNISVPTMFVQLKIKIGG